MAKSLGGFRAALLIGWIVLAVAGFLYARAKVIPTWAAASMIAAFLAEYPFYLVPAFPCVRERLVGARLIVYLVISAVLPYLVACFGAVHFEWFGLLRLVALALALALWYVVLPPHATVDVAFLVLIVAVILGKFFDSVYATVDPSWRRYAAVLGHITLIQVSIMVLMLIRRTGEFGYGFVPTWREWQVGATHYLYFVLIGFPLAYGMKAIRFDGVEPIWKIVGLLLAFLWVTSLSEEYFFRGVLLNWIEQWTWNHNAALLITSVLFGLVHLWFRGFPNWRWALVATLLGWFCGRARTIAGGIRAGVVTHALVVTTWQAFFT